MNNDMRKETLLPQIKLSHRVGQKHRTLLVPLCSFPCVPSSSYFMTCERAGVRLQSIFDGFTSVDFGKWLNLNLIAIWCVCWGCWCGVGGAGVSREREPLERKKEHLVSLQG